METNKKYMVVQIGCIECGVSSYQLGVYDTLEEANEAYEKHPSTWESEGWDGYVAIWVINEDNTIGSIEWKYQFLHFYLY